MRNQSGGYRPGRRAVILGLGYTGRAVARRLLAGGWVVTGTTRARADVAPGAMPGPGAIPGKGTALEGARGLVFDGEASPGLRQAIAGAELLVSSVPPDTGTLTDPVLAALPDLGELTRAAVVYLGATSVYGDRGGQWAFEGEAPRPGSRRGLARAEAELLWLETGLPVHVLRLAGIYGGHDGVESRSPFSKLDRAVIKPGHVVNRIHVDDIAELVVRIADRPAPGIYNVADGHPADPAEVVDAAARMAGAPPPARIPWTDPSLSPMARSFYAETKRIDITRARETFGWEPALATWREGLSHLWQEQTSERERGTGG